MDGPKIKEKSQALDQGEEKFGCPAMGRTYLCHPWCENDLGRCL